MCCCCCCCYTAGRRLCTVRAHSTALFALLLLQFVGRIFCHVAPTQRCIAPRGIVPHITVLRTRPANHQATSAIQWGVPELNDYGILVAPTSFLSLTDMMYETDRSVWQGLLKQGMTKTIVAAPISRTLSRKVNFPFPHFVPLSTVENVWHKT